MTYYHYLIIALVSFCSAHTWAYGVSSPEAAMALHCDSEEDYQLSKQGAMRLENIQLTLTQTHLIVSADVKAVHCKKLSKDRYQWVDTSPYAVIEYPTEHFDTQTKTLSQSITRKHTKDVWLNVINQQFALIAKATVKQPNHHASAKIALENIADMQALNALKEGQLHDVRIGLFLKNTAKYTSKGVSTPYEESDGVGMHYLDFAITRKRGYLEIRLPK